MGISVRWLLCAVLLLLSCATTVRRGNLLIQEEQDGSTFHDWPKSLHQCEARIDTEASDPQYRYPWYVECSDLGEHYFAQDPHVALGWLRTACLGEWEAKHDSSPYCDQRSPQRHGYLDTAVKLANAGSLSDAELKTAREDAATLCRGQRERDLDRDCAYCIRAAQLSPVVSGKLSMPGVYGVSALSCEQEQPAPGMYQPQWWQSCRRAAAYAFVEGFSHLGVSYLEHGCRGAWNHRATAGYNGLFDASVCSEYFHSVFGGPQFQTCGLSGGCRNVDTLPATELDSDEKGKLVRDWEQICHEETQGASSSDAKWLHYGQIAACEYAARALRALWPNDAVSLDQAHSLARAGCDYYSRLGVDGASCDLLAKAYGENAADSVKQGKQSTQVLQEQLHADARAREEAREEERAEEEARDQALERAREQDRQERRQERDEREAREAARSQAQHDSIDSAIRGTGNAGSRPDSIAAAQQNSQRQIEQTRERVAQQQAERERQERDRQQRQVERAEAQRRQAQEIAAEQRKQAEAQAAKRAEAQHEIAEREEHDHAERVREAQEREQRREAALKACVEPQSRQVVRLHHAWIQDKGMSDELTRVGDNCFGSDKTDAKCAQARHDCEAQEKAIDQDSASHSDEPFMSDIRGSWLGQTYRILTRSVLDPMPDNTIPCGSGIYQDLRNGVKNRDAIAAHHLALLNEWQRWYQWAQGVTEQCAAKARGL